MKHMWVLPQMRQPSRHFISDYDDKTWTGPLEELLSKDDFLCERLESTKATPSSRHCEQLRRSTTPNEALDLAASSGRREVSHLIPRDGKSEGASRSFGRTTLIPISVDVGSDEPATMAF